MNTYCCDIHIPDVAGRANAVLSATVRTRNVMSGCHAATLDESIAKAIDVSSDPRGYGDHEIVYIVAHELCGACGSTGQVPKKRGKRRVPYAFAECKSCKGAAFWYAGKTVTVLNIRSVAA